MIHEHGVPNSSIALRPDISDGAPRPNINYELINILAAASSTVLAACKTLNDLVPARLKRQKKWDDGYANKTPEEIDALSKAGDQVAKTMKEIYENAKRLMEKQSGKPK